ncbi:MAG: DUF1552 domain-containing protein [Myxococcota bacterium]
MSKRVFAKGLSRRALLGGALAGGALGALAPMHRLAQAMDTPARRFVFFLSGNGFDAAGLFSAETRAFAEASRGRPIDERRRWGEENGAPRTYNHSADVPQILTDDLNTAPALAGLGPLAEKAAVVLGLSSTVTGGFHGSDHGVLSSTRTLGGRPGGVTIDAYLAGLPTVRGAGDARAPVAALRAGVLASSYGISYDTAAARAGQPLPTVNSAASAWDAFVGPLVSPDGVALVEQRTRMLEAASRETELQLRTAPAGRVREQLESHETAIAELLGNQSRFIDVISAYDGTEAPPRPEDAGNVLDRMRAHAANVAFALRHGVTNVAVLGVGVGEAFHGFNYDFGAIVGTNHTLRHNFAANEEIRRDLREVWRQEVEAFLSIARVLEAAPEGDAPCSTTRSWCTCRTTAPSITRRPASFPHCSLAGEPSVFAPKGVRSSTLTGTTEGPVIASCPICGTPSAAPFPPPPLMTSAVRVPTVAPPGRCQTC